MRLRRRLPAGRADAAARLAVPAIVVVFALAFLVPLAAAASPPEFLLKFGAPGASGNQTGAGQTNNPRGIVADPATGHIYVAEASNSRISEFTSWGEFVKAWGWGVEDGSPELQVCTTATGCEVGLSGSGAGQFNGINGIALDSSGDIYAVDLNNHRVQKFSPSGAFILMFGGDVNKTKVEEVGSTAAERNLCTAASGNICQAGTAGSGSGEFGEWQTTTFSGAFIAVDSNNAVYVGEINRIEKFNAGGAFLGELALPSYGAIHSLAIDSADDLYVVAANVLGIHKLNSAGAEIAAPIAEAESPRGLATDVDGNLYVIVKGNTTPEIVEYDSSGLELARFGKGEFSEGQFANGTTIVAGLLGDGTQTPGDVYVANSIPNNGYVVTYGPQPQFEAPPAMAPTIGAQFAESVAATTATLRTEIDPRFWDTRYHLEYGSQDCAVGSCTEQPVPPASLSADDRGNNPVAVTLGGLAPGTTYHYRFVASSECEVGNECVVEGPDRTFTTGIPGPAGLPDARAYELVSPTAKEGGEVGVPTSAGGSAENSVEPQQASPSGDSITYGSFTSFGKDPGSAPATSQYYSRRGSSGWMTDNINPRYEEIGTHDPLVGFSTDLLHGLAITTTADALEGFPRIFLRDNRRGSLTTLTPEHLPEISVPRSSYCLGYAGISAASDRVIFSAKGALNPGDPVGEGFNLYEWSAAGGLHLVSLFPSGSAAPPTEFTGFGSRVESGNKSTNCSMRESLLRHAISADGSKIFWTYPAVNVEGGGLAVQPLFARVDGSSTVQLDALQGGSSTFSGGGRFQDASVDGSKVFFTDAVELTAGSTAAGLADLYLYDFDRPVGERLADLTVDASEPANVQGVIGASDNGSLVYFVAKGALAAGATAGKANLYVWHAGEGIRFVATLEDSDNSDWSSKPNLQTARVSPDGSHLAFLSTASLKGYDNTVAGAPGCQVGAESRLFGSAQCAEVFVYNHSDDKLICASCNPSGARPQGPSLLPIWRAPFEQPRYLSNRGRLFFETFDALDAHDTNGKRDVYEFEQPDEGSCSAASATFSKGSGGCLYLISSGSSSSESYFLDASSSGDDAFFSTSQGLVYTDGDGRYDVYDARVGGSGPPPPPPSCEPEGCRGTIIGPPAASLPGTPAFHGAGNPAIKRCRKGTRLVRKKGKARCVKVRCRKGTRLVRKKGKARCVKVRKAKHAKHHRAEKRQARTAGTSGRASR